MRRRTSDRVDASDEAALGAGVGASIVGDTGRQAQGCDQAGVGESLLPDLGQGRMGGYTLRAIGEYTLVGEHPVQGGDQVGRAGRLQQEERLVVVEFEVASDRCPESRASGAEGRIVVDRGGRFRSAD